MTTTTWLHYGHRISSKEAAQLDLDINLIASHLADLIMALPEEELERVAWFRANGGFSALTKAFIEARFEQGTRRRLNVEHYKLEARNRAIMLANPHVRVP